jgi:hypothetical protein
MIKLLSSFEHVKLILFLMDFGGGQAPSSQTEGYLLIPLAGKMISAKLFVDLQHNDHNHALWDKNREAIVLTYN